MNENTLISIHGYAGDANQIKNLMPYYQHHGCQLVVLSPADSKITPKLVGLAGREPGIIYGHIGQRAYIGPASLERQKQHLRILLTRFPHQFFLMNDSDSFCLSPEIPKYLYDEPDVFWSNEVSDEMHKMPEGYPYPRLAFQPPYFCSRKVLEGMVKSTETLTFESCPLHYIDYYMMRLAHDAGIKHRGFVAGVSCPTNDYPPGMAGMLDGVENRGSVLLHSVKTLDVIVKLVDARTRYVQKNLPR
jgi:hypothetical protein